MRRLEVLSSGEADGIHEASLRLLEEIGVNVPDQELLELLDQHGSAIDREQQVAKIPEELVKETLTKAPKGFSLHGRDSSRHVTFGEGGMKFLSSGGQLNIVDPVSRSRRLAIRHDTVRGVKLGDALENINIVGALAIPSDVPPKAADVVMYAELFSNTVKPVFGWIYSATTAGFVLEMAEHLAGGPEELQRKPLLMDFLEPISPLRMPVEGLAIMKLFCRRGLPVCFGPMVMAGATGPVTLGGAIAMENAENLAGITLAQLLRPGVPVLYGGLPHIMDPRLGSISFGSPEQGLMAAAITQVARRYGVPVHVNVGLTDANIPDAQAGAEKAASLLMAGLAGAELSGHLGIAGTDQGACLEQLCIDDEIAAFVLRMLRSLEVNEDTLALDVARRVGVGGSFLAQPHTARYTRSELWIPRLLNREIWDRWQEHGATDALQRANEKVEVTLRKHTPEPLDRDTKAFMEQMVAAAIRELSRS